MLTLLALAVGAASGWLGHKYRDKMLRVKEAAERELKK